VEKWNEAVNEVPEVDKVDEPTLALSDQPKQETGNRQNGKHDEEDLADARSTGGNTTKAENCGNQGNHKKYNGVMQHGGLLFRGNGKTRKENRQKFASFPDVAACFCCDGSSVFAWGTLRDRLGCRSSVRGASDPA
jgi:hypothetical protein